MGFTETGMWAEICVVCFSGPLASRLVLSSPVCGFFVWVFQMHCNKIFISLSFYLFILELKFIIFLFFYKVISVSLLRSRF